MRKLLTLLLLVFISRFCHAQNINSIEELKSISGNSKRLIAQVLGYYQANDGGGGLFYWDAVSAATSDNALIIKPTGTTTGRWIRITDRELNARWFGCRADGVSDDSEPLREAFYTAQVLGKDLFIPAGIYRCNKASVSNGSSGASNRILYVDNAGLKRIRIYGEKGTKLTTSYEGFFLTFYSKCNDCLVENIWFESTHGLDGAGTTALHLQGLGGKALPAVNNNPADAGIENFMVRNCRFTGFHQSIIAMGVDGLTIENCFFEAPLGHDNSTNTTAPAVFITFFDNNTQGACWNVKINNCIADGFTGTDIKSTTTKKCMDGFIWGTVYGLIYTNNITRNLQEEHVLLKPQTPTNTGDWEKPILLNNNIFYGAIPLGCAEPYDPSRLKKAVNLIRCDVNNAQITGNQFYDCTAAILIRPHDQQPAKGKGFYIADNKFRSVRDLSGRYHFKYAINVQGFPGGATPIPAQKIVITDNFIDIDSVYLEENNGDKNKARCAIQIYDAEKVVVDNNKIFISNVVLNSHRFYGFIYGRIQPGGLKDSRNMITGAPTSDNLTDGSVTNIQWMDYSKRGQEKFSGNNINKVFRIAHGMGVIPAFWNVTAASSDARDIAFVTADDKYLYVNYNSGRARGINNIVVNWEVSR